MDVQTSDNGVVCAVIPLLSTKFVIHFYAGGNKILGTYLFLYDLKFFPSWANELTSIIQGVPYK